MYMITKRTKIMLAVLVLVALAAYAYLYWWSKTDDHGFLDSVPGLSDVSKNASNAVIPKPGVPAPGAPAPGTGVSKVAYRTYTNTELKLSFEYPETWLVTKNTVGGKTTVCLNGKDSVGGCLVSIALEKESVNVSMDKTLEALRAEFRAGTITESTKRVAGETATVLKVSGYPTDNQNSTRAAVFTHDMSVYTIEAEPGQQDLFDHVTSSFAFQK